MFGSISIFNALLGDPAQKALWPQQDLSLIHISAPDTEALPAAQIYTALAERFAALGAKNFLFEPLSSDAGVAEAARQLKEAVPDAFVLVSFCLLYTSCRLYQRGQIQPDECSVRPQRSGSGHAVRHTGPHQPQADTCLLYTSGNVFTVAC